MSSVIAWLDQSDEHQRQMREAIGLFRDEGAVDELGMGRIRDTFSDRLFPGTSVLWRRARYLLFVPWIYMQLEEGQGGRGSPEDRARMLQRRLARALTQAEGAGEGVIGASGADVKQTADVIMWNALERWGVRVDPGGLAQIRAAAVAAGARGGFLEEESAEQVFWHPRVRGLMPEDFPSQVSFELGNAEARLLAELLDMPDAEPGTSAARRTDSLLAAMVRDGVQEAYTPWDYELQSGSNGLRVAIRHAGCFSDAIQGARLLYALLVAEARNEETFRDEATAALGEWAAEIGGARLGALKEWATDLDDFFAFVRDLNPNIGRGEEAFVRNWTACALTNPEELPGNDSARDLVADRERAAKGALKARLGPNGSVGRDAPAVLQEPLTFRWFQAVSIATDIEEGLERSDA